MTWKGKPESFKKQNVKNEYGHMFDMYFERPKTSLKDWIISEKKDYLNNPYSQLIVGQQKSIGTLGFDIIKVNIF